jgi:membrane protein DedA with SNARE-associated domain
MQYSSLLQLFSVVSDNIGHYVAIGGYPILFLTVILEGLPLIGTLVPGHVAIIAGGFLAHTGILNVWLVVGISFVAAILGDAIGFYFGRHYGMGFIDRFKSYFFIRDAHLDAARKLLTKHTGKAMILGRLSPVTRALMPFIVGAGKTDVGKFWLFNVIGASVWVVASVILGYGFGFGYQAAAGYFGKAVVIAAIVAGLMVWGYRFINVRFHIFRKYELFALIINIVSLLVLAFMIRDALSSASFMANFDIWVNGFMNANVGPALISIAEWTGLIGGIGVPICAGIIVGGIFVFHGKWRSAGIMLITIGSAYALFAFMKEFIDRARPENALQLLTDPSFPSGHATMAAAFFFVCAYLFSRRFKNWILRESFIVICALATIAIGLSRIVLNVHWVSDVIAGWALGIFCATASIIFVRYISEIFTKNGRKR